MYEASTLVLMLVTAILGWLQFRAVREKRRAKNEITVHPDVRIYIGRDRVAQELVAITRRAHRGDTLFGSCRTCANYTGGLYEALAQSVGRGAVVHLVLSTSKDAEELLGLLGSLDPSKVELTRLGGDYPRMYGIAGKEVLMALPSSNAYIGCHFRDRDMVESLYRLFRGYSKE